MVDFKDRQQGYEAKFAHDSELRFKANARRNKLLGYWVADQLGKQGDEREAYAKEVVTADFEEAGDDDVFRKVRRDLPESVSDGEIRNQMIRLMAEAVEAVEKKN